LVFPFNDMTPGIVFTVIVIYFIALIIIARITSRGADTHVFFTANRQSPWYIVAFGMIGSSLSGVTFISVPGEVGNSHFEYFQIVLGYLLGYLVVGGVLMPLYYRLNLITIYTYLESRFGFWSYKTGAFFFLLSRTIGSSFRLYLVAMVLQIAVFDAWGIPLWVTVLITLVLIWLYTNKGGVKTIIWTDTIQAFFMLATVGVTIFIVADSLGIKASNLPTIIADSDYSSMFIWDWRHEHNFFKQFLAGAFISISMTGLDQDMMQKNLTCKNIKEAQKNMFWFSIVLVFANLMFLSLGALLYMYADAFAVALPEKTDYLFPMLALNHFSPLAGILFILGIIAAAYSSADSALTALTTSFCVDILNFRDQEEAYKKRVRTRVHIGFSALTFMVILMFALINDESVINSLFTAAGYTYGPLLGLFAFGMFTKYPVKDRWVPWICLASPLLSYVINIYSAELFWGYRFGFEILLLNGLLTFVGLFIISGRKN